MSPEPCGLRRALLETVEELYRSRLITPTGGNVSVRVEPETVLITPRALFKGGLREEDLVLVDLAGRVLEGVTSPSRETPLHTAIYRARPDVGAIIHSHPPLATVFGLYDRPVRAVTADAVGFRQLPVLEFLPPGSQELAVRAAAAIGAAPAALLRNHGAVVVGSDLRQAANRTHALEETCLILLLTELLGGEPALIPETAALLPDPHAGADPARDTGPGRRSMA